VREDIGDYEAEIKASTDLAKRLVVDGAITGVGGGSGVGLAWNSIFEGVEVDVMGWKFQPKSLSIVVGVGAALVGLRQLSQYRRQKLSDLRRLKKSKWDYAGIKAGEIYTTAIVDAVDLLDSQIPGSVEWTRPKEEVLSRRRYKLQEWPKVPAAEFPAVRPAKVA
jgi:hypothetical protein